MAGLDALAISNLRVLRLLVFDNTADFNLVTGDNGTGKTTVLEAIFLAGHGRSFRTYHPRQFIRHGAAEAGVRARLGDRVIQVRRDPSKLSIQIDGKASPRAKLVGLVPVRKFIPQDHTFIEGSSVLRRQYLDWGLFHLEGSYRELWARYVRVLRQRNAELKGRGGRIGYWNRLFCQFAEELDSFRQTYWNDISERVHRHIANVVMLDDCHCEYFPGWKREVGLSEGLAKSQPRDTYRGYTSLGPHRADLRFSLNGKPAKQHLSRGQQKLWNIAMNLAQVEHHHLMTGQRCVWLIDDLASELDQESFARTLALFRTKHSQFWLTAFAEQKALFQKCVEKQGALAITRLS